MNIIFLYRVLCSEAEQSQKKEKLGPDYKARNRDVTSLDLILRSVICGILGISKQFRFNKKNFGKVRILLFS